MSMCSVPTGSHVKIVSTWARSSAGLASRSM